MNKTPKQKARQLAKKVYQTCKESTMSPPEDYSNLSVKDLKNRLEELDQNVFETGLELNRTHINDPLRRDKEYVHSKAKAQRDDLKAHLDTILHVEEYEEEFEKDKLDETTVTTNRHGGYWAKTTEVPDSFPVYSNNTCPHCNDDLSQYVSLPSRVDAEGLPQPVCLSCGEMIRSGSSDKLQKKINKIDEGLRNPKDNPCWKGYKPVGTKKKGGRTVPNCVPVSEDVKLAAHQLILEVSDSPFRLCVPDINSIANEIGKHNRYYKSLRLHAELLGSTANAHHNASADNVGRLPAKYRDAILSSVLRHGGDDGKKYLRRSGFRKKKQVKKIIKKTPNRGKEK